MTSLQHLHLRDTGITDSGMEALTALSSLQTLYLSNTQVTDDGLEILSGLNTLERVYLDGTLVTDAGVREMQAALPGCWIERLPFPT